MIKLEDYLIPDGANDEEITELMRCRLVRICNIYTIIDKEMKRVPFRPKAGQMRVLEELFIKGHKRLLIPKARQHGISTLTEIIILDMALFTPDIDKRTGEAATLQTPDEEIIEVNIQASIVERNQGQAEKRLQTCKVAWDCLPKEVIAGCFQSDPWNKGECTWDHGSSIIAGKSARGGTNYIIHVSEWGVIAYEDPKRAKEIETGALQSVPIDGYVIGESTHMGGKAGEWYDKVNEALEVAEEDKTALDFYVLFLGWWEEPEYSLEGRVEQITDEINQYLDEKEIQINRKFTPGQRLWYFKKRVALKRDMFAEYPTVLEECWMAPSPGLIYASDMDRARSEGRITENVAHFEQLPVYNVFDLGAPANTVCWQYQLVGDMVNFLGCLYGGDDCKTAADWTRRLKEKTRYSYGGTFLPHDGEVTWKNAFDEAGLDNVICLLKPVNVWQNINEALGAFSRIRFHKEGCADGIRGLDAYHSKEESDGVTIRAVPVHNWASHPATGFSYAFQAMREGRHIDRSALPAKGIDRREVSVSIRGGRKSITSPGGGRVTVTR